jgi:predicted RNase H-like nuclease
MPDNSRLTKEKYLGVDGCKAGWFFVAIGPGDEAQYGIFENMERLYHAFSDARWILIDIPIGLPSTGNKIRSCDKAARKALSPKRQMSIFSPSCREALKADSYIKASRINRKVLGKGISQQAYHISKKIQEIDDLLSRLPDAGKTIHETHPEICFWALAGFKPMAHYKKTPKGLEERLELLKRHYPRSSAIYKAALGRYLRKHVGRDDILDALALAVTASKLDKNEATLPEYPGKDALGRPMEMVYAPPEDIPVSDTLVQGENLPDTISNLIQRAGSKQRVFPATEYFNETWLLRIVLDWFSNQKIKDHPLSFAKGCRWFSEGLIPTQFRPRARKDPLGESWTHADAVIGHFQIGQEGRADIRLSNKTTHLSCIEAKMFSKLSAGVTNARYFNQAARYIACMAELMHRAKINPGKMKRLAFFIFAPEERIDAGVFSTQIAPGHIKETVKRRVSEYKGEKDQWYGEWFLPTLGQVDIQCLSWESIIALILKNDPYNGGQLHSFYLKCMKYNRPARQSKENEPSF